MRARYNIIFGYKTHQIQVFAIGFKISVYVIKSFSGKHFELCGITLNFSSRLG